MMEICDLQKCTGCEACVSVCPVKCISMVQNNEGFLYPKIDSAVCLKCRKCVKTCPNNRDIKKGESSFFMGWHKDKQILLESSSGGAFTAIADFIIKSGGIVYGASFNEQRFSVEHKRIDRIEDLKELRLSKYFQGTIEDSYIKAKKDLNLGKQVLFTGTACQIAGLYCFLDKEYENLLTVDVLCHGIASKKVIDAYILAKEKKYRKKIKSFRFRLKPPESEWMKGGGTKMRLDFSDGTTVIEEKDSDTFFIGFNKYLFLRKSCYSCKYVGTERIADITLADFWGIDLDLISEEQRKNGVSLIIVNSSKGENIVSFLGKDMIILPADSSRAISANQALSKPSTSNLSREAFFRSLNDEDFDKLVHKYNRIIYLKLKLRKLLGNRVYDLIKHIAGRV